MTNGIIDSGQEIVTNGLVLHLDAAQRRSYSGTGTNWRDLISGTNATLTNGAVFNSSNGGNVSFDGVDDYVDTNRNIQFGATSSFSLESYFYLNSYVNSQLINNESGGYNGYQLSVTDAQQNTIFFSLRVAPGNNIGINFVINNPVQKWTHVLLTYDGSGVASGAKLYADGVLITGVVVSDNLSGTVNSGTTTRLGRRVPTSYGFLNGKIGLTRIYNRELSATEAVQNYNAIKARFEVPALLDLYPNAAAAYSLRRLRSGYTGSAIRVRRSSDNTEQDIGFTSTGDLDTTALTTFVGANNGFVTTWYDQSGNNRNATQTIQANQPIVVSGGTVYRDINGKVWIKGYENSNTNLTSQVFTTIPQPYTTYTVLSYLSFTSPTTAPYAIDLKNTNDNIIGAGYFNNHRTYAGINLYNTFPGIIGKTYLYSVIFNTTNSLFSVNNNTVNGNIGTISADKITIFNARGFNGAFNGYLQEFIFYPSNQPQNSIGIETNINSYYGIYNSNIDSDAQSFITAAAITDFTQQGAVDALVKDLKNYGLWTKMKAIYPFVGGTAASHKFNLKDPRDVDGAFRLVFNGGWTHSATGALPDGTTGYADTRLLGTNLNSNSLSMSYYSRTNNLSSKTLIGARFSTNWMNLALISSGLRTFIGQGGLNLDVTIPNSLGLLLTNRVSDNLLNVWKNTKVGTDTNLVNVAVISTNLTLSALNSAGTIVSYNNLECAFATIGDGLTDTEAANLYTAVQKYQTTLGRQV